MKQSRDPYNKVGRFILEELKERGVSYDYACRWKEPAYIVDIKNRLRNQKRNALLNMLGNMAASPITGAIR